MSIFRNHLPLMGAAGSGDVAYNIRQSIRFDEGNNAYMHRTPSGASNRRTWTWSGWLKHSGTSANGYHNVWSVRSDNNNFFEIAKRVTDTGENHYDITNMTSSTRDIRLISSAEFRDPSAWYHFVFVVDTTQAQAANRVRFFVNGERITNFSTETYPSLNLETFINTTNKHEIGAYNGGSGYMMDGYMADIHFIDGYAYGPEYFGTTNSSGIWIPIDYDTETGNYGTNGFKIDGSDSATLGKNVATGNTYASYTSSGLAAHDKVLDTPNNNFSTLNPLIPGLSLTTVTYAEGNLKATYSNNDATESTIGIPSSGKWYFEGYVIGTTFLRDDVQTAIGLRPEGFSHQRDDVNETGFSYAQNGKKIEGGGSSGTASSYGASYSADDIIGVAVDMDASPATLTFYKNNASQGTAFTFTDKTIFRFGSVAQRNSSGWILNFGQDSTFAGENVNANDFSNFDGASDGNGVGSFFYTPPSGYLALCTSNLFRT